MSTPLHRTLADLARDHGRSLFGDATAFRGALDDYLDEGQASGGTINLLTDAVRLGALDGLMTMLNSGAQPTDAVESAGQRLARDRGSSDVRACQWAVAVLGFALGRVPETIAIGLSPDLGTAPPPTSPPTSWPPAASPPTAWPAPPQQPGTSPPTAWPSPQQQPATSPPTAWPTPQQQGGTPPPPTGPSYAASAPGWTPTPPPSRGNTAFIASAIAVAVVVLVVGVIAIVALAGGGDDDDPSADPTTSADSSQTSAPSSDVPDIGGPTITGTGYTVQVPDGWTDGTEAFTADNPDLGTLDSVAQWGKTFQTSRGNLIIETQSAFGSEDPADLGETWKEALIQGDDTAEITERPDRSIAGQPALTVEITRTNDTGVQIHQRSHLVINGDTAYSLTITGRAGDEDVVTAFDEILSTWQWAEGE